MPNCFVIQPFDAGKYDKRFEDVYAPAISAANLTPYRVDKDPTVDVPIDSIEEGIRGSLVCLADITTDNPNVWYELGYAFASGRPVVMVCSEERTGKKYPFDIQHRTIIPYQADSPSDFKKLKTAVSNRLRALLKRTDALKSVRESEQIAPVKGLSQPELAVLATIAGSIVLPHEGVSAYAAKTDVERAGFTPIAFAIGLKRLREKELVGIHEGTDFNGETFQQLTITIEGWNWIEQNSDKFILQKPDPKADDLPF